ALGEQAFREFEKYADQRGVASSSVTEMYDSAMELIEKNIYSLSNQWAPTVAKYRAIVDEALSPAKGTLPGIFDQKIVSDSSDLFRYNRLAGDRVTLGDVRDMVSGSL